MTGWSRCLPDLPRRLSYIVTSWLFSHGDLNYALQTSVGRVEWERVDVEPSAGAVS
jgi:hypothetical protein